MSKRVEVVLSDASGEVDVYVATIMVDGKFNQHLTGKPSELHKKLEEALNKLYWWVR